MKRLNLIQNHNGMSVLEVMIAVGIMSIITFGMISMNVNTMRSMKYLQGKNEYLNLSTDIRNSLSVEATCKQSVLSHNLVVDPKLAQSDKGVGLKMDIAGNTLGPNLNLENLGLEIRDLRFANAVVVPGAPVGETILRGNLIFSANILGEVNGPKKLKEQRIAGVGLKLNSANAITSCTSSEFQPSGLGSGTPGGDCVVDQNGTTVIYKHGQIMKAAAISSPVCGDDRRTCRSQVGGMTRVTGFSLTQCWDGRARGAGEAETRPLAATTN